MTNEELLFALRPHSEALEELRVKVEGLERREASGMILDRFDQEVNVKASNAQFAPNWHNLAQVQTLREMLLDLAKNVGLSREQIEAEYDRRWRIYLDEMLQKAGNTNPSGAAHTDDSTEDELPEY